MSWTEPLLLAAAEAGACRACGSNARWEVEPAGWAGTAPLPEQAPRHLACDRHLPTVAEGLL